METRASYTLVGAFVLGLIGALIGVAVWLAGVELGKTPTRYLIYFDGNVTGLGIGSAVRYRGVPVGSVREINIDTENVERVRVMIDVSKDTPIKTDTVAEIGLQGITGVAFIQLTGGTQTAPPLSAVGKNALAVIQSRRSLLQEVVTRLPELLQKAVNIADHLALLLEAKNIQAVSTTLENIRRSSEALGSENGDLAHFLRDGREAVKSVHSAVAEFQNFAARLNERIGPLAENAGSTMADAKSTLAEIRLAAEGVTKVANSLQSLVSDSEGPIQEFAGSGLYELSLFLGEARVLVGTLTRLADRIERDPAQFFFGDSQKGVEAK